MPRGMLICRRDPKLKGKEQRQMLKLKGFLMTSNSKLRKKVVSPMPRSTSKKLPTWPKVTPSKPPRTRLLKMQRTRLRDREPLLMQESMRS